MNLDEFFIALGKTKEKFEWKLVGKDIRGTLKGFINNTHEYCPLTAVCLDIKNINLAQDDFVHAASILNLSKGRDIAMAADFTHKLHAVLRERILETVGLEPDFEDYVTD